MIRRITAILGALAMNSLALQAESQWQQQTQGVNLVAGRDAWLFPHPNWGGQKPEYYKGLLTDGVLSENLTYGNYEAPDAVRWAWSDEDCIILFDLERPEPLEKVVARFYGGQEGGERSAKMAFPKKIEVFASNDRQTFHRVAELEKTLPAERDTADWKRTYYLDEKVQGYCHVFTFPAGITCRYIGLRISRDKDKVLIDEVAVIKGNGETTRTLDSLAKTEVVINAAKVSFRTEKLHLTPGVPTPNWVFVQDTRDTEKSPVNATLNLPDGVELVSWRGAAIAGEPSPNEPGRVHYRLPLDLPIKRSNVQGPLYLRKRAPLPPGAYAILTTKYDDAQSEQRIALDELEIPAVPDWSGFSISLGWMWDEWSISWPDFFQAYRHLGFNTVPTFPRYYGTSPVRYLTSYSKAEKIAFLEKARTDGFAILYNESPLHVLFNKRKSHPEILNQVNGKPGQHLSPLYRGEHYQGEMARIARHITEAKPEIVFLDIELWNTALSESRTTPAFREALKASGKTEGEFLAQLGEEMIGDIRAAILQAAKEAGIKPPEIGLYGFGPKEGLQQGIFSWNKLFGRYLDFAMPSLYVAGDVQRVHKVISESRKRIGTPAIIPWLTAGTYGTYPPPMLEYMIYETLLNGARGFTYYWYADFDPAHFYHHAKALHTMHPFKELLKRGAPLPLSGSNELLDYTAIGDSKHRLVLIGNYNSERPQTTRLTLPGDSVTTIRDLRSGTVHPPNQTLEITVEGKGCVLLEVQ